MTNAPGIQHARCLPLLQGRGLRVRQKKFYSSCFLTKPFQLGDYIWLTYFLFRYQIYFSAYITHYMKLIFTCLLVVCISTVNAQTQKSYYTYWANYYAFQQDVQMVEIIFGIADIKAAFTYSRMNSSGPVPDANQPIYLFRNTKGEILRVYNLGISSINDYKILSPEKVNPKDLKKHRTTRYSVFENAKKALPGFRTHMFDVNKYADLDMTNARWGLVDFMGNVIIKPQYQQLTVASDKMVLIAKKNGSEGLLDENGKQLHPFVYDNIECISYNGGSFLAKRKNKSSYFNNYGQQISKREYDFGESFWSRRARVAVNGMYGYIDSTGTEVVPLIYKKAEPFYYNVAVVGDGKKFGMINNTGNLIEPIEYDRIIDNYDEKQMVTVGYFGYKGAKVYEFNREGKLIRVK